MMQQRVLITGHNGYIGSVMAPLLAQAGHESSASDTGYFDPCTLVPDPVRVPAIAKTSAISRAADLDGFDAVIHLAALSNDPIGNLDAELDARRSTTKRRYAWLSMAKAAGVRALSVLLVLHHVRHVGGGRRRRRLRRWIRSTEYARSKVMRRASDFASWPATGSRRPSCATARSTASRRGCASTPC